MAFSLDLKMLGVAAVAVVATGVISQTTPKAPSTSSANASTQTASSADFLTGDPIIAKWRHSPRRTATIAILVSNPDSVAAIASFWMRGADTTGVEAHITLDGRSVVVDTLSAGDVHVRRLIASVDSGTDVASARLLMRAGGRTSPVRSRTVSFTLPQSQPTIAKLSASNFVVLGAFVLALLIVLFAFIVAARQVIALRLGDRLGLPTFDISQSWATSLTAILGISGMLLTSAVFPATPMWMSRAQYTSLTLLFGMLVVLGPALYFLLRRSDTTTTDANGPVFFGFVGSFFLASLLIMTAVFGQLGLSVLMTLEYGATDLLAAVAKWSLVLFLGLTILSLFVYAGRTIPAVIKANHAAANPTKRASGPPAGEADAVQADALTPSYRSWSLL